MSEPGGDPRRPMDLLGAAALGGFAVILGLNQALVKIVNDGLAPVFQVGVRSIAAFLPVLLFALFMRKRLSISDGSLAPGIMSGLLFSVEFCLLFLALELSSVARVSLFFYTMPVWLALVAHFVLPGERLNLVRASGLAIAIGGVALALLGDPAASESAWLGDMLALLGALAWGGIAIVVRTTRLSQSTPEMALLYQLAVSGILLTAMAPLVGDTVRDLTPEIIGIFAFQVIVVVAIGFAMWIWALSIYRASDTASFSLLSPVVGVFVGWLLFDDPLTPTFLAALGLVLTGLILVNRR